MQYWKAILPALLANLALGAKIELHQGQSFQTETLVLKKGMVYTDTDTIPRSEVREIIFETKGGKETGTVSGDRSVQMLLEAAAVARRRFPEAKGILLADDGRNTLHGDGTRNYSYHLVYLILSEARKGMATFRHYFKEGENEVKVHFARVIKPDGKVTELDLQNIRIEVPPREDIVFFGKGKWITFTLPGVQVGDIVEYSYENIRFDPWNEEVFEAGYYFRGDDPFVYSRLVVDVPKGEYIQWKTYNDPDSSVRFTKATEDESDLYTWVAENTEPYVPEPNSPPEGDFLARLEVINQKDWDEIFTWYAAFQDERLKMTPRIEALVDSLTSGAQTKEERVARLYHWVQLNVRYISIKGSAASGVSGHPAQFTLERGFGDCTDKAILFATMLRAAGVDADPVIVGTNDDEPMLDPGMPSIHYGDHAITEVFLADTNFFLDATGSSNGGFSRYPSFNSSDHGIYAVNSQKRKVELIPVPKPEEQLRTYRMDMEIDTEGNLLVDYHSTYRGFYETALRYFWNFFTREEDRRIRFEQMVKQVSPDAELTDYGFENLDDLSKQLGLRMTYRVADYVKFAGPVAIIRLPEVKRRLSFDEVGLASRQLALTYSTSEGIQHQFSLKLPEEWKIDYLPPGVEFTSREVSYKAHYSVTDSNLITYEDFFSRPKRIIEPEVYPDYKALLGEIASYHEKPILVITQGGER